MDRVYSGTELHVWNYVLLDNIWIPQQTNVNALLDLIGQERYVYLVQVVESLIQDLKLVNVRKELFGMDIAAQKKKGV